jgi:F-box/leucine-rich repeat protein 2/20
MSTVILFELPVDVFRSCLVPFLDLRSVARLDTSTLNFNLRSSLHDKLSNCTLSDAHYAFYKATAAMLKWMSRRRVGLENMWLHNSVTDPDVLHLHPMVTKALVDVSFCQCNRLSAHAIIAFLSSCDTLLKLNLVSTSAHCGLIVTEIARHCPLLSDINMVNGIASDTNIFLLAQRCRALRVLKLRKCDWITDNAVEALARYLPGLQELSLHCQDRITDTAIIMLMQHCTAMTVLELDHCNLLTDAAVVGIAGAGASLTYLDLYGCTEVTDVGVTAIAHGCPKLTGLCLAGRKQLSDASIVSVVQSCSGLTSLNLCFCYGLTDASLHAIAAHCPALISLLLMEVYNITSEGVWAVRKGCTELFDLCGQLSVSRQLNAARTTPGAGVEP